MSLAGQENFGFSCPVSQLASLSWVLTVFNVYKDGYQRLRSASIGLAGIIQRPARYPAEQGDVIFEYKTYSVVQTADR